MGPLKGQNMPIIIGGVLVGAALLLWMRAQGSQQVVSNQPALTLYPSTEADRSTVANIKQALDALNKQKTPTSTQNPTPASVDPTLTNTSWFNLTPSSYQPADFNPVGSSTPVVSNSYWSGISSALATRSPNAMVADLFPASQSVPNSASPEVTATTSQYQALVLGQYAGATGIHAIGAPVDVMRGSTPEDNALTVNYLKQIQASGAYNPNLPAISSPQAVRSLLYSMTQDPKYL